MITYDNLVSICSKSAEKSYKVFEDYITAAYSIDIQDDKIKFTT